jgi:hypothetical protein
MADPTGDVNLIAKVLDWGWAGVLALGGLVWKGQNEKINVVKTELGNEISLQRQNIAKIFDKLEANTQRAEDRHHEILSALHAGLDRKADK